MNRDDGKILEALRNAGIDMSIPHEARHYFYLGERAVGEQLALRVSEHGYRAQVSPGVDPGTWLVLAVRIHSISDEEVARIRILFERIAAEHAAEYDGWEVGIRGEKDKAAKR